MIVNLFPTQIYKKSLSLDLSIIKEYCYNLKNTTSGRKVSNRNGWQSDNISSSTTPLNNMFIEILKAMNEYKEQIGAKGIVELDNMWININPTGGTNITHIHPHSFMSGVYYIQTPNDCGNLYFENPNPVSFDWKDFKFKDFTKNINAENIEFHSKENDLYIFPSWAKHGVYSNTSNTDRISISFNGQLTNV